MSALLAQLATNQAKRAAGTCPACDAPLHDEPAVWDGETFVPRACNQSPQPDINPSDWEVQS